MSKKTVLSVGQCRPDSAAINHFLTANFDVTVLTSDVLTDTIETLAQQQVDLILVNRKLDADYSDGMEVLHAIRKGESTSNIPVMLISNFADWQQKAVDAGAIYGFGKDELNSADAVARVSQVLTES